MTTQDKITEEEQQPTVHDLTGGLAESARRHIAYERLARQAAASEAAARLVLDALARAGRDQGDDGG